MRSKWQDDYTARGAEVKSKLVATEVAYGTRDDCFVGCSPAEGSAQGDSLSSTSCPP